MMMTGTATGQDESSTVAIRGGGGRLVFVVRGALGVWHRSYVTTRTWFEGDPGHHAGRT